MHGMCVADANKVGLGAQHQRRVVGHTALRQAEQVRRRILHGVPARLESHRREAAEDVAAAIGAAVCGGGATNPLAVLPTIHTSVLPSHLAWNSVGSSIPLAWYSSLGLNALPARRVGEWCDWLDRISN